MIRTAKHLNPGNQEILLAYLHFLHMTEHLPHTRVRARDWAYRTITVHWVRPVQRAHWVGQ